MTHHASAALCVRGSLLGTSMMFAIPGSVVLAMAYTGNGPRRQINVGHKAGINANTAECTCCYRMRDCSTQKGFCMNVQVSLTVADSVLEVLLLVLGASNTKIGGAGSWRN